MKRIQKMTKFQKTLGVILIMLFGLALSFGIPTLARFKNRTTLNNIAVWDGSIATGYKSGSGTEEDPYVISNGSQLAYLSEQLKTNNYENTYFKLEKDIVLNNGIFDYDNQITYQLDETIYYVENDKYYSDQEKTQEVGTINLFSPLNGFKGHFNGEFFRIYGLYINNQNNEEIGLFTDLEGQLNNLYVENSLVYGMGITGGIASSSKNATIKNVLFDGFVIGNSSDFTKTIDLENLIINTQNFITTSYINTNAESLIGSSISAISIKGSANISNASGNEIIEINGTQVTNDFDISLGTTVSETIPVTVENVQEGSVVTLSNLQYIIEYNYAVSGGIIALGENINLENVINKGNVYNENLSGGLVGISDNITINQSYNNGQITNGSGLIGTIYNNALISKSYSTSNGLIGRVLSGTTNISNSFNTSDDYSIGSIDQATVSITNSFNTSNTLLNDVSTEGTFDLTTIENLTTNIEFNNFVNYEDTLTNTQNVWVSDNIPILFIDDINNPIAKIYADVYSWDNLSNDLNTIKLDSAISFTIQDVGDLNVVKEKSYYIANKLLTTEELNAVQEWIPYTNLVQLTNEGIYVVYAKIIDHGDNVKYINTDMLIIDSSNPLATLTLDNYNWSNHNKNPEEIYINSNKTIQASATDISGIKDMKYYITDKLLNIKQLNQVKDWLVYENGIEINEKGKYIVYLRVIDNNDYTSYINTDFIIYDGYQEISFYVGKNNIYSNEFNITNNSSVTTNISYDKNTSLTNHTHNVMTTALLPLDSKIIIRDNTNSKTYEYKIIDANEDYNFNDSCGELLSCTKKATYPFTLFKEVGTTQDKYYLEPSVQTNENFTIIIDFNDVQSNVDYENVKVFVELHDANNKNVRPTLEENLHSFNIYANKDASLKLTTPYEGSIDYDSDSTTDVVINSRIDYQTLEETRIVDTTYEGKKMGLAIKLFDSSNAAVDKNIFKNISFKIGDQHYYPEKDNTVHINLNNDINDTTVTLNIATYKNNNDIKPGTYYIKIYNYVSYDGNYYDELGSDVITIPLIISENNKVVYGFDVIVNDEDRIINKNDIEKSILFKILQSGDLLDPNIQVSLYKKEVLTAFNQNYLIVDLKDYVTNDLEKVKDNVYYAVSDPIEYNQVDKVYNELTLNLNTSNFENNSYKFVFDLYDGNSKVGTINKYFIIK